MAVWSLLLLAALLSEKVTSQFAAAPGLFERPLALPRMGTRSQLSSSNVDSNVDASGSMPSSIQIASIDDFTTSESSRAFSVDGEGENSASGGNHEASGSWIGSGSSSREYGCDCRMVRRVSLMGASDYCLAPEAPLSSKCGNIELAENGACPMTGAQPCSLKGHVLANDSLCAMDDKDETYKCVASKDDLEIQKNGGKTRKRSSRRKELDAARRNEGHSQRQLLMPIAVCVVAGVMVVM